MKLFFIVGENSGDALAAPLINALKEQHGDDIECLGIGGPKMKKAGFTELLPMSQISVIGIWEVIPKLPHLLQIKSALLEEIEKQQPDAVITIDFPDFNFIIAKALKKRGVYKGKTIHYVAPSVWAWRPGRAEKIAQFMDGIMCLFPMELDYFTKHGMKAVHVGHPLINSGADQASAQEFREENSIDKDTKTIGFFFGSRESEFKNIGETIKKAAILVNEAQEGIKIIAPTLPDKEYDVQKLLEGFPLPVYVTANPNTKWQAFKACDVAIAVSGTVALELAYAGVPHVIAYKANPITAMILRLLIKVKHAHLANILLDKTVVPECLQEKCTPEHIAKEAIDLLNDEDKRAEQQNEFKKLAPLLGAEYKQTPSQKAAQFITDMIAKKGA